MKRTIAGAALMSFLISALAGCSFGAGPSETPSETPEIPVYSSMPVPDSEVPYYDELPSSSPLPSNIPEDILTIFKAQELFQHLGFEVYEKTAEEDGIIRYQSVSSAGALTMEERGLGIVSAIQLTLMADPMEAAGDSISKFLYAATGHILSQDEKNGLLQKLEALKQQNEPITEKVKIDGVEFSLQCDTGKGQYIVSWE